MKNVAALMLLVMLFGCVESEFELAQDSRLPAWFALPAATARADVAVTLTYYTTGPAKFQLLDRRGRTIGSFEGEVCWHPDTLRKKNIHGGWNADSYPHYVYFKAKGVLEVIEHRREPRFWISDDARLRQVAAELPKCLRSYDDAP